MKMSPVTKILVDALNLMKGGHWSSGSLHEDYDGTDRYCAMGAISKVAEGRTRNVGGGNKPADQAAKVLASVIPDQGYNHPQQIIPSWNDDKSSFRPIKAAFCKAIKKSLESQSHTTTTTKKRGPKNGKA